MKESTLIKSNGLTIPKETANRDLWSNYRVIYITNKRKFRVGEKSYYHKKVAKIKYLTSQYTPM